MGSGRNVQRDGRKTRAGSRDRSIRRGHEMTAIQTISRARFAQGAKAQRSAPR